MIRMLSDSLYEIHRDRAALQEKLDKRKATVLTLMLFAVVAIGVLAWILQ